MSYCPAASETPIIQGITLQLPRGHAAAVIGPSGCGKSTLLKTIAGLVNAEGVITWDGRDLAEEEDLHPWEIGYVPQFGIAYEQLTARENVANALRMRIAGSVRSVGLQLEQTLEAVGLADIADRHTSVLSGGQRRRLALAQELVSNPDILLCDEVTSGLDPRSDKEITKLLCSLATEHDRLVVSVTHSLTHMHLFNSIVVMHEGYLVYHGPPAFLLHYFGAASSDEVFPILTRRTVEEWDASWRKHSVSYLKQMTGSTGVSTRHDDPDKIPAEASDDVGLEGSLEASMPLMRGGIKPAVNHESPPKKGVDRLDAQRRIPGFFSQTAVCFSRRMTLFARDRGQLVLHFALMFGFPLLVVVFAIEGLPSVQKLSMGLEIGLLQQLKERAEFVVDSSRAGTLVSGLIVFQMVLLALMGANNAAREVAGERLIFEKEKLAGLRPTAYLCARVAFLSVLVLAQSAWMAWFVDVFARFPGNDRAQMLMLIMMNASITATSLAISTFARSPDQASLLSIYLVGFQLPLSGALLALPQFAAALTRPFIACYWAWSGFLNTMKDSTTDHYDAAVRVTQTALSPYALCLWVLVSHIAVAFFLAYSGLRRPQWD